MLNVGFIFNDANHAMAKYSQQLKTAALPAAVYMLQLDVINHYRYALDHYFTISLNQDFLQNSSLGTPYQKWAFFTNRDFMAFSFAMHNLLRYTARLIGETECAELKRISKYEESTIKGNSYTGPIGDLKYGNNNIGITIHEDESLSIISIRDGPPKQRVVARSSAKKPSEYFLVTKNNKGQDNEEPITKEEYNSITSFISTERISIRNRDKLEDLYDRGKIEIETLVEQNLRYEIECKRCYKSRNVIQSFGELHPDYWI